MAVPSSSWDEPEQTIKLVSQIVIAEYLKLKASNLAVCVLSWLGEACIITC